jgi:hypothetical protein
MSLNWKSAPRASPAYTWKYYIANSSHTCLCGICFVEVGDHEIYDCWCCGVFVHEKCIGRPPNKKYYPDDGGYYQLNYFCDACGSDEP